MFFIKKIIIITSIIISFLVITKKETEIKIPIESIRIRIIANSNSVDDQNIKLKVKNSIEKYLYSLTQNSNSLEETREIIKSNINNIDELTRNTLKENNFKTNYTIKYGLSYFPKKEYKGVNYSEGNYESLVIILGEGNGENWWCVLFPPLCMIDAEENQSEVEYKFIVEKIIKHFM